MTVPMRTAARFMAWFLTGCLARAWLLAQTLGLMHGVAHGVLLEAGNGRHAQALSANHGYHHDLSHDDGHDQAGG